MAYKMKSSPAKLGWALKIGAKLASKASKAHKAITGTTKAVKQSTKSKAYRYDGPQRGARNADGTRR